MKLLHIDSSILGDNSVSRALSQQLVEKLVAANKGAEVTRLDLAATPIAHLTGGLYAAQAMKPEDRTAEQKADVDMSAKAMDDFLAADIIVIGTPMYNFGIPSQLKAWIDRIAVAGKTFKYTATGPVGLAGGKRVFIVSSRGGFYGADTPNAAADHQEQHLKAVMSFVGITDVTFIRAEGVAVSPDNKKSAIESAQQQISQAA